MDEIITNEYIRYKTGFYDGSNEIIEKFTIGNVIKLNEVQQEDNTFLESNWYDIGYKDGFTYYANLIDEKKLDLQRKTKKQIVKEMYFKRVEKINQQSENKIPASTFIIKR